MEEWINILIRSVALVLISLIFVRIMGKRHPAKMSPFTFVSYTVIAIIAALISLKVIESVVFGLIALVTWTTFLVISDYLSLKSKWFHDWIHGKETILIKQGKVMEENLLQVRLTGEDLLSALRTKSVFNITDVEFAILEPTGDINVLLKSNKKPVTPYDLGEKVAPQTESQTVILDGNVLNEPLASMGLNQQWLNMQLENTGVSLDNVFIGQVDASGDLYVDLFDDAIQVNQPRVKDMLYANLEISQANFMTFALETQDKEAKRMYTKNADKLKQVIEGLKPYLIR